MTIVSDEAANQFQMAQPGHPLLEDHIAVTTLKLEQHSTRGRRGKPETSSKNMFPVLLLAVALKKVETDGWWL